MLRNYIKIAIRSLLKNSVYSFINIFGLAFGLGCSLLIVLWVNDELSFDDFHQNKNDLYQVFGNSPGDNGIVSQRPLPLPLVDALKTMDRDVKYATVTDWGGSHLLQFGEKSFMKEGLYASEDFLKMFSFDVVQGSAETALKDPSGIVMTESAAKAIFADADAMDQVIRMDNTTDLKVVAIIKDVPVNSTFQFEYLIPFSTFMATQEWVRNSASDWGNNSFQVYAQLNTGADHKALEERQKDLIKNNQENTEMTIMLHPLPKWRLYSRFENGQSVGGAIETVRMFAIVAIFILIIACINFMNLATARSERRAREVGIRKSVGSRKKELILQFLGESILVSLVSFILAVGLTELVLPYFNNLVGKKLTIDFLDPIFWAGSMGIVLITGIVAGSYPAFYLSSFNAASVLKGKVQTGSRNSSPRKILVTLQFVFSIFLIAGTIVFNQQIQHGKQREIGYDQENLLMISNEGDIDQKYEVIKNELLSKRLATSVTKANSPITQIYAYMGNINWEGKKPEQRAAFATIATEYDYTQTMGIKIKEGRDFSREYSDSSSVILNQAAIDYMGLKNPIGETLVWDGRNMTIVGVTHNVLMSSVYRPVEPTMIVFDPGWFQTLSIRLPKGDISGTMKEIESIFKTHNPAYPFSFQFADSEFERKFARIELITQVANLFAVLAIIISCLGLFGLAAFTAEQRTKEIGIRKVMGASIASVLLLLTKDFTKLVVIAFAVAAPLAWWALDNWLEQYPYRIEIQWWTLGIAGGATLVLALLTVSSHALKAAVSNPAVSLRSE